MNNSKVKPLSVNSDGFVFTITADNIEKTIHAKGAILATGRFPGGGLHAGRDKIIETVFDLPVVQPGKRRQWYGQSFFLNRVLIGRVLIQMSGFNPSIRISLLFIQNYMPQDPYWRITTGSG